MLSLGTESAACIQDCNVMQGSVMVAICYPASITAMLWNMLSAHSFHQLGVQNCGVWSLRCAAHAYMILAAHAESLIHTLP